jgi:ABC-2 type transport system permease protein
MTGDGYAFRDVARMEWIKLRTLRSVRWTLLAGMAATVAFGIVAGFNTRDPAGDPTNNVLAGILIGQLITAILGALAITSEFSSGSVAATFGAVPRRWMVLAAKAAVSGAVFLVAGEAMTLASFLLGTAVLHAGVPHPSLADPAVARAVVMTGGYLALMGLTGLGVGALVRHSGAAVGTVIGGIFVAPAVIGAAWHGFGRLLPETIAGNSLAAVKPVEGFAWSPWLELGIVALYPAILLVAGGWLLERRDA